MVLLEPAEGVRIVIGDGDHLRVLVHPYGEGVLIDAVAVSRIRKDRTEGPTVRGELVTPARSASVILSSWFPA